MAGNIRKLPTRQVHLDFHTGPYVPDVGKKFDKKQFQEALKKGHVNSITVFAKCHHGLTYYPSKVSRQHPTMEQGFDLTGAMIDACHEIGVAAPVYITVGFSEDDAKRHQEWRATRADGTYYRGMPDDAGPDTPRPFYNWDELCPSGDYAELVYALTEEVCQRYENLDGLFYDIIYLNNVCYCKNCMKRMQEMGRDPYNEADNRANFEETHHIFAQRCTEILHKYHPTATVFFNSGGAEIYHPNRHCDQTHFEMEDLPTAWGGYDKFAPRASVMRRYADKEFLGMTGKFHASWGEFGGYKNPDAMEYEALVMGMYGAACSIGDQMPPSGEMDMDTYKIIGQAYASYEKYEPWFFGADDTTKLGVYLSGDPAADGGLAKMLMETQKDFRVVLPGDDLTGFDALILPDCVAVSDEEAARLNAFPGAILFSGTSLVKDGKFQIDAGCEYAEPSTCDVDYFKAEDAFGQLWVKSPFLCYKPGERVKVTDGEVLAQIHEPWFNRTKEKFCSHCNTSANSNPSGWPAAVRKGNRIYLAHKLSTIYYDDGVQLYRDALIMALDAIYTPVCSVKMPSAGRMRFTHQAGEKRYVLHLTYAQPIARGKYSVLEDMPEIRDIPVTAKVSQPIAAVRYALTGEKIAFCQDGDTVTFTVPHIRMYGAIELVY